jgi:hypothetical protein
MLNREQKIKIVDFFEKMCEKSRISKKTLGNTIRSYHVSIPFLFLIFLFYGSHKSLILIIISMFCCLILFYLSNGCLLTMLEHRLCGDDFTIADPFIEHYGMELNNKNRVTVSYYIAFTYIFLFLCIYSYRFFYNKK